MGVKTWILVYADGNVRDALSRRPLLDREATDEFARTLFPSDKLALVGDGELSYACPPGTEVLAGCFPGVSIVAAKEFAIDYPSKLPKRFVDASQGRMLYLHAMHSVVDWTAFAQWNHGELVRSLSLSPDGGILEDIGKPFPFEEPFWAGQHPAVDDDDDEYPFEFHPLDLGEAALRDFFGYQLEGPIDAALFEPQSIPLVKYQRPRSWWKLW